MWASIFGSKKQNSVCSERARDSATWAQRSNSSTVTWPRPACAMPTLAPMLCCSMPIWTGARTVSTEYKRSGVRIRDRRLQTQGKLVIADPREDVAPAGAFADAGADLQQRLVAAKVPVNLIELLELVETQQQHAHFVVGAFQDIADVVLELAPIGQLRQRVAHRRGLRLKLGSDPLRPFAALVADAAEAEYHQRHAEKIHKRRGFGPGTEQLLQQQHAAPIRDGHKGYETDRENHQNVDDFPPGRCGQREGSEKFRQSAQRGPLAK